MAYLNDEQVMADFPVDDTVHYRPPSVTEGTVSSMLVGTLRDLIDEYGYAGVFSTLEELELDDTKRMNALLSTTDASRWASEFCRLNPDMDEGTMLAWFSSAIETGRSHGTDDHVPIGVVTSYGGGVVTAHLYRGQDAYPDYGTELLVSSSAPIRATRRPVGEGRDE
jgi:hypothetical protein